jgi:hypothetical protein
MEAVAVAVEDFMVVVVAADTLAVAEASTVVAQAQRA